MDSHFLVQLESDIIKKNKDNNSMDMNVRFELFVSNIEKSVTFYRDVLRFIELPNYGNYHPMHRGKVKIGIGLGEKLPNPHYFRPDVVSMARKGLGVEFVLEVENIDEEYKYIQSTKYPISEELKKQDWGLTDFRLVDPDGYYLRITSKHETQNSNS